MPFCPECGAPSTVGDPYCGECGALQEISAQEIAPAATRGPASTSMTGSRNNPTGLQLAAGTLLRDRYKILRRIGGGGMGSVYLAEDAVFKRLIAVKEMVEMFADDAAREKAIADFQREAELLAHLDHQAIPTIFDYFFDDSRGRYYLVMKYIDGGDLASRMQALGGKVDEFMVAQWGVEICDVLDYIHSQSPPIIYRDLKPANLMLDTRNRIMLVDFGIARFVAPTQKGVTAIGTMGYAPPELFAGNVEPASDIYSLGATMFHLLTGHDPQDNPLLIFDFTKNPKPRQINPDISAELEALVMKAVEYKPESRFTTARSFGKELKKHLRKGTRNSEREESSSEVVEPPPAAEVWHCIHCGHEMSIDDIFCAFCGKRRMQRQTAKLIVVGTNEISAQFTLNDDGESLIGRTDPNRGIRPAVDLSRYDPAARVSRKHAKIIAQGNQFFIEDLGSANGTFVNGQIRLPQGKQHALANGDEVRLGETIVKFIQQ